MIIVYRKRKAMSFVGNDMNVFELCEYRAITQNYHIINSAGVISWWIIPGTEEE